MKQNHKSLQTMVGACLLFASQLSFSNDFTTNNLTDAVDASPGDGICATAAGVCSLRAAIMEANALTGDHNIFLMSGTYSISIQGRDEQNAATGDLDLGANITITGAGAASTIVNANAFDRVFEVISGNTVVLNKLSITGGRVQILDTNDVYQDGGLGGGIYSNGSLTLNDVWIYGNSGMGAGGGVYSQSSYLELNHTLVYSNDSSTGAGLTLSNGGTVINDSFIVLNPPSTSAMAFLGGGIFSFSNLDINNSLIYGNRVQIDGGGIYHGLGTLDIKNTTISNNSAARNGGGLFFRIGEIGTKPNQLPSLTHVTISNNVAQGLDTSNSGDPIISFFPGSGSFTFPNNQPIDFSIPAGASEGPLGGGGVVVTGQVDISQAVEMTVVNSIIADNYRSNTPENCSFTIVGSIRSIGGNMDSDGSCGLNLPSDLPTTDPQFNAFDINNMIGSGNKPGLTQAEFDALKPHTQTIAVTSPAIDNALDAYCTPVDQPGRPRPSTGCDIGAFEVLPPSVTPMQFVTQPSGVIQSAFSVSYGEGLNFVYEFVDQPTQGNVGFDTQGEVNGNWIYTADANAAGNDSFTYRTCLSDGVTCSAPATIGILFSDPDPVTSEVSLSIVDGSGVASPVTVVNENQLLVEVADVDYTFPLGTFFFDIKDLTTNGNGVLTLTIQLPANTDIPVNAVVRKLDTTGTWRTLGSTINTTISSAVINGIDKTITLNLIDNDVFDSNPATGVIRDPIALAIPDTEGIASQNGTPPPQTNTGGYYNGGQGNTSPNNSSSNGSGSGTSTTNPTTAPRPATSGSSNSGSGSLSWLGLFLLALISGVMRFRSK